MSKETNAGPHKFLRFPVPRAVSDALNLRGLSDDGHYTRPPRSGKTRRDRESGSTQARLDNLQARREASRGNA